MYTEMIGLLIIVVVALIVIVKRQIAKKRQDYNESLGDSARQFQLELEEAADLIVKRMENHVDHLELLIQEADEKILLLDEKAKIAEDYMEKLSQLNETAARNALSSPKKHKEAVLPTQRIKHSFASNATPQGVRENKKRRLNGEQNTQFNLKVFEMLENGRTVDEIAKLTGVGKGAILLIKEMYKIKSGGDSIA